MGARRARKSGTSTGRDGQPQFENRRDRGFGNRTQNFKPCQNAAFFNRRQHRCIRNGAAEIPSFGSSPNSNAKKFEIINLGGGKNPKSINYVIGKIEEFLGKKAEIDYKPFHKADMKETWADIKTAWKLLKWKPQIDLDNGIQKTVEWYMENKDWLKNVKL